jgi:hypothetical protein
MADMRTATTIIVSLVALPFGVHASCYCSEPNKPSIPTGYYAEPYQMESAKSEVESFLEETQDYKQCLVDCIEEANSNTEEVIDEWNSAVQQFNNR